MADATNLFRTCPRTGLQWHKPSESLIKANAVAAVVALLIGGVLAIIMVLTRWQAVHLVGAEDFYMYLTAHGLAMLAYWIIFFEIAVLYFCSSTLLKSRLATPRIAWAAFALMVLGSVMNLVAVFKGDSTVMFTSYVPLPANPMFYLGLILFAVGALIGCFIFLGTLVIAKAENTYEGSIPLVTFGALTACTLIAFGLAWLLNDNSLRGARWFRLIFFLPVITDWVATALVWQLIFLPHQGVLPGLFHSLGLSDTSLPTLRWTASRDLAPVSIIIFTVWKTTGLYMVIFLAGLKSIPKELIEAARVDGAREWGLIRHVILPLLSPITVFVILVGFVNAIGMFEPVWMLTGGGPAEATKTLPLFIHETFFRFRQGGYASAAAILFLLITLTFAFIATWIIRMSAYKE
jgi:ABC-type sugar transport system permease subunit